MSVQYRELYDEGRRILEAVPIPDAALDARLLLEEACGTDLQALLVYPDRPVEDEMAERYRALIGRRRLREPTAMILGKWEFMGLPFKVTKDTLIPEQDTEVLVEAALARMGSAQGLPFGQSGMRTSLSCRRGSSHGSGADTEDGNRPGGPDGMRTVRILDLCTGSGCILLIPVIAGISFEFLRYAGRHDNIFVDVISAPGVWLQHLTVHEPDESMVEVAIASVEAVFDWRDYLKRTFGYTEEDIDAMIRDSEESGY